jgi:pyridoxamine 5'-phosphate oxidase
MDSVRADRFAATRHEYAETGLVETDLAPDPITQFARWYDDAVAAGLYEPNAMVVSTVSADGRPSSRYVLLKGISERGFVFFTNLGSRKGAELGHLPACALLFPWHPVERQVRVEGVASELPRSEVDAYFASRPRGAQLGAWASHQSTVVTSREELDRRFAAMADRFPDEVPTPDFWGGYLVVPQAVEFWQGRPGRMHDRLAYERVGDHWATYRLAP